MEIVRYGTAYGGWYLPKDPRLYPDSTVYSVGVGMDISFDCEIADKFNCDVYLFDPTPEAIEHVDLARKMLAGDLSDHLPLHPHKRVGGAKNTAEEKEYWTGIAKSCVLPGQLRLTPVALATENGKADFYQPKQQDYVSCSLRQEGRSSASTQVTTRTLSRLMADLKHSHLDLLKIDIEGTECEVLDQMLEGRVRPRYLCVEFDREKMNREGKKRARRTLQKLQDAGYKMIHEQNVNRSFVYER